MLTRREVLEHLVTVWGVREPARLRKLTREFLAYRARWHAGIFHHAEEEKGRVKVGHG